MHTPLLFSALGLLVIVASGTKYTRVIEIESGSIRGFIKTLPNKKEVRKYLGIPYAQAERFEHPVAPKSWTGVKDMTSFGKVCYQVEFPGPFGSKMEDMSEDCLNLNVYVPNTQTSKLLPVMVWIHGGGFVSNNNRISEGSYLATLGEVVVVSINYRLFYFGFLASKDYDLKGNYGLYDQLESLKWVQKNIDKFGGDPKRVTIFGNSAGGASVSHLIMSPLAKGLFKYTIMQSGVSNMPTVAYLTYKDKSELRNFAEEKFGCTDANMKQCLKDVSATDFVNAGFGPGSLMTPVFDGEFLSGDPLDLVKNGNIELNTESVLMGVADDDGSCGTEAITELSQGPFAIFNEDPSVFTMITYFDLIRQGFTNVDNKYNETFLGILTKNYNARGSGITNPPDQRRRIILDVLKDVLFTAPSVLQADMYAKRNVPLHFYQVRYGLQMSDYFTVPSIINAYHETEKFMVFGYALKSQSQSTSVGAKLSREVIRMWTNFAKTGDPNSPQTSASHVQWPQYKVDEKEYLVIQPTMEVKKNLRPKQVEVWNSILPSLDQSSDTKGSIIRNKKMKKNKNKKKQQAKQKKKPYKLPFGWW